MSRIDGPEPSEIEISRHACVERGDTASITEVVGESATTISLRVHGTFDKPDPEIRGPFRLWARFEDHVLRAIDETADAVLLICHPSLAGALGFTKVGRSGDRIAYAWVRTDAIERLARPIPVPATFASHRDHAFVRSHLEPVLEVELADVGRCRVVSETRATLVIEVPGDGLDIYTQEIDKRDARLLGPHLGLIHLYDGDGALLRIAADQGGELLVVAEGSSLAPELGLTRDSSFGDRIGYRWLSQSEAVPIPGTPTDWPPDAPALDDKLRAALETYSYMRASFGRLRITAETADSFTLAGGAGPILALKDDSSFTGDHLHYIRHEGHLLRVVRELPGRVLVVAHGSLGRELGFPTLATFRTESLAGKWLPPGPVLMQRR